MTKYAPSSHQISRASVYNIPEFPLMKIQYKPVSISSASDINLVSTCLPIWPTKVLLLLLHTGMA